MYCHHHFLRVSFATAYTYAKYARAGVSPSGITGRLGPLDILILGVLYRVP